MIPCPRFSVAIVPYSLGYVSAVYNRTQGECDPENGRLPLELSLVTCQFRCGIDARCHGFVYYDDIDEHCHVLYAPCTRVQLAHGATTFLKAENNTATGIAVTGTCTL